MGLVTGVPAKVAMAAEISDTPSLTGPGGTLEEPKGVPQGQTSFFLSAYTHLPQ